MSYIILETKEYNRFETITGNRVISVKKVDRIVKDVKNGLNLFPYCPIVVTNTNDQSFNIIDGQHRFTACKKMELPIFYIVAENIDLRDIARMNSNTDKWTMQDFLDCYIKLGIEDYKKFKILKNKYNLSFTQTISLFLGGTVKGNSGLIGKFKDGQFEVLFLTKSLALLSLVDRLFPEHKIARDNNLMHAVMKLHEANLWVEDKMREKLEKHPDQITPQTSPKNYIFMLEQIYNSGSSIRKIIF